MESQPQNPEFRTNPENIHPLHVFKHLFWNHEMVLLSTHNI